MANKFLMWGERGLVATLFCDLSNIEDKTEIQNFFNLIEWTGKNEFNNIDFDSVTYLVEPDFSNTGFGHPDGVIVFEKNSKPQKVIILEAKRSSYARSSASSQMRGTQGFNSRINGQFELNYCLTLALSNFNGQNERLKEPDWILNTPYNTERKGVLKSLLNSNVIENIVKRISGLNTDCYYHLLLSTENSNPFNQNVNLPEIFTSQYHSSNQWSEYKKYFGFINYNSIIDFYANTQLIKPLFPATYYLNSDNFGGGGGQRTVDIVNSLPNGESQVSPTSKPTFYHGGTRGTQIIYAPAIDPRNPDRIYHFSWLNESAALRYYEPGNNNTGNPIRRYSKSEIENLIEKEENAPYVNVNDINFWVNHFSNLRNRWIKSDNVMNYPTPSNDTTIPVNPSPLPVTNESLPQRPQIINSHRATRGTQIIYAPSIDPRYPNRIYHLSWRNESAALRFYEDGYNNAGNPNRNFTCSNIENKIEREEDAPYVNVNDINFWEKHIKSVKERWGN